jgi:Zn-dependent peptidase ImmA (M78 family)
MSHEHPAEKLIADFGISDPRDIDVDAIAHDSGVEVRYEVLNGCDATLLGIHDKAIATIQKHTNRPRQRFSVGHELGHWYYHRGEAFRCRVDDVSMNLANPDSAKEREADQYAAHLLLPGQLFKPLVKQIKAPSLRDLDGLAGNFKCSLLCAALRLIDVDTVPAILACHDSKGFRWFRYTKDIPRRWYLKDQLDEDSFAYDLLASGKAQTGLRKSGADTWFTNADGKDYELLEHSVQGYGGEIITLILPSNDMLDAKFDPDAFPTKFNEMGAYTAKRPLKR